jgi:hypothetical protein
MAFPGYTAEASLYVTSRLYGGYSPRLVAPATGVAAQASAACPLLCEAKYFACGGACTTSGPLLPVCVGLCFYDLTQCMLACDPHSGGGGTPLGECPHGHCCERDNNGHCTLCVPTGGQCP